MYRLSIPFLAIALLVSLAFVSVRAASPAQVSVPSRAVVLTTARIRSGPSTTNTIVGRAVAGQVVNIVGCNIDCSWYQIADTQWMAAFLVDVSTTPPTPTPTLTPTPVQTTASLSMTLVSWNVESGGALQKVVADRIAGFQDVDIWGLSEVSAVDAEAYEFGAEEGEDTDYEARLGITGGADRLLLMWDTTHFAHVASGELLTIGETGRAPLWVQLSDRHSGQEFIVMVNHLHRSNEGIRRRQATALNTWATQQTLPIIAMGDYNFDWNLPNGEADHDVGYDNLTANGIWEWVRPAELVTTQCSGDPCKYNSVLDFFFVAGAAQNWNIAAQIIVVAGDFPADFTTPDHRPVIAAIAPVEPSSANIGTVDGSMADGIGNTGTVTTPQPAPESGAAEPSPSTATPTATPTQTSPAVGLILGELAYDGIVPSAESDEYIEIVNGGAPINVSGWVLRDDDGNAFTLPIYEVGAGSHCRVYTNEFHPDYCGFSFGSSGAIWGNSGDKVELVNPGGVVVDTACWKSGC